MDDIVNKYPYNAYTDRNQYDNRFINKKLGIPIDEHDEKTGLEYGYPYIYRKNFEEYPIEGSRGPTTIRRKYKNAYKRSFVTIDSRERNLLPRPITKPVIDQLIPNSLSFVEQSNIMSIYQPNHGFQTNDSILISNAVSNTFTLNSPFSIKKGKSFMRITFPAPGHLLTSSYNVAQNLYIQISNVTSDVGIFSKNLINGIHQIFLTADFDNISGIVNDNFIYIQMPKAATYDFNDTLDPNTKAVLPVNLWKNQGVILDYLFLFGIPLFYINTGTPADINHVHPYLIIQSVTDANNYTIQLDQVALQTGSGGGNCVQVTGVDRIIDGYPNPNNYIYNLKTTYINIVSIRLISTEFPYSGNSIQKNINDKVYWQDLDDVADYTYSANVPAGIYDAESLQETLENSMNSIVKVKSNPTDPDEFHMFQVSINSFNNIVSFFSFRQFNLANAMFIKYTIEQVGVTQNLESAYLYVIQPNHGLVIGDTVDILYAPNYDIVPKSAILGKKRVLSVNDYSETDNVIHHDVNGVTDPAPFGSTSYTVSQVLQLMGYDPTNLPDIYKVQLPLFVPLPVVGNTAAGFSPYQTPLPTRDTIFILNSPTELLTIQNPTFFRMFFDQPDTLGSVLGFRKSGEANSYTNYQKIINNYDPYFYEPIISQDGVLNITQNALNLTGENYFFMCSPIAENIEGKVSNILAKIECNNKPHKILYNTFVHSPLIFPEPLKELKSIQFMFQDINGNFYDFNGRDHSFTLEIIEFLSKPNDINVSSRVGHKDIDHFTSLNPVLIRN